MGGGGGGVQETADQVQEQKNNVEMWNYYQTTYKPYIDKHIAKVNNDAASSAHADKAAGQVNAEAMKAASANAGNPSQPDPINTTRQLATAADVGTSATVDAAGKVKQRHIGSQQNFVDIGRGQQTQAQQEQSAIAGQSVRTAIADKENELRSQGMIENSIGAAIGGVAGAVGGYMRRPKGTANPYGDFSGNEAFSGAVDNYGDPIGQ